MKLLGNLDCEARWAGVALPEAVRRRISLYATLFAACSPGDPGDRGDRHELWVPAPVDPARLLAAPGWVPPAVHVLAGGGAVATAAAAPEHSELANADGADELTCAGNAATIAGRVRAEGARRGGTDAMARTASPATDASRGRPRRAWPRRAAHPPADQPRRAPGGTAPVADRGFDLAWADPAASAANDRSRTLTIAEALGVALPGARAVASLDDLDEAVARFAGGPWVCKARWTSAGRDRARGAGRPDGELRTRIARMLARFGPLVVEPWLDRIADFGICGEILDGLEPQVRLLPPHRLRTDPRGGFLGIELAAVDPAIAEALHATARAAAARLAADTGYRGPFAIDAFRYRDAGGAERLHPLCEINARYSFGWIAHGLARRLGIRRLGFDAPPAGVTQLIAPGDDGVTAWCA